MVGDQHVDTARMRCGNALDAGDAVVDRDDQPRQLRCGERDDLGGQPVTELETVGYQEVDRGTHRAETAHADRARGRAVGIVVGDDQHALLALDAVGKPRRGRADTLQRGRLRQSRQFVAEVGRVGHAARRVDTRKQRCQARGNQRARGLRHRTSHDFHADSAKLPRSRATSVESRGAERQVRSRRASDSRLAP